ncbi:MAG: helix-turn-helix transcriptional regulator [Terriglobia bacterium]
MAENMRVSERVKALMESKGMKQPQLADALNVNQSLVSRWLSGDAEPSVEACMKLADLAVRGDPAEAVFFWNQTGIDSRFLVSLAEAMLRTGEPNAQRILPAAEAILRQRAGDPKALEEEGKIVLVPPYIEGEWKDQASLPPLPISADFVTNLSSVYYLIVEPCGYAPPGLGNWDRIVFDAFGASEPKLGMFLGEKVLVNLGAPLTQVIPPHEGGLATGLRLRMGRLITTMHGGTTKILFIDYGGGPIHIDTFSSLPGLPQPTQAAIRKGTRIWPLGDVVDRTQEEELKTRLLPAEFAVLGRVVGYYPSGKTGHYEMTPAQLRRSRGEGGRT